MPVKLSELANLFGCKLEGNPNQVIDSISTLENAKENSLCFFLETAKNHISYKSENVRFSKYRYFAVSIAMFT